MRESPQCRKCTTKLSAEWDFTKVDSVSTIHQNLEHKFHTILSSNPFHCTEIIENEPIGHKLFENFQIRRIRKLCFVLCFYFATEGTLVREVISDWYWILPSYMIMSAVCRWRAKNDSNQFLVNWTNAETERINCFCRKKIAPACSRSMYETTKSYATFSNFFPCNLRYVFEVTSERRLQTRYANAY